MIVDLGDSDDELDANRMCRTETEFTEFRSLLIAPIEFVPEECFFGVDIDLQIGDLFSSINNRTNLLKKSLAAKKHSPVIEVGEIDVDLSRFEEDNESATSALNESMTTVVNQPEPFRVPSDE